MLTVSERAAAILHVALREDEASDDEVFRLSGGMDELTLLITAEQAGDHLISHEERHVLAVDRDIAGALDGAVLDALDTPEGPRLILRGAGDE